MQVPFTQNWNMGHAFAQPPQFAVDHGCVRGGSLIDAEQWERALRVALGDPT